MTQEQRIQERFELKIPVKVANAPFSENPACVDGVLSNISAGGVFISSSQEYPIASKIYLQFNADLECLSKLQFILSIGTLQQFSNQQVLVNTSGIVIRVQKDGSGIIFDTDYTLTPI